MKTKLYFWDYCILRYMEDIRTFHDIVWVSPTKIGMELAGKSYNGASSWGSRKFKKLVKLGLVVKEKGKYALTYNPTKGESFEEISLCKKCYCMTHTVNGYCGKCKEKK